MQFKAPFNGMMLYQTNYEGEKYAVGDTVQFGTPFSQYQPARHSVCACGD